MGVSHTKQLMQQSLHLKWSDWNEKMIKTTYILWKAINNSFKRTVADTKQKDFRFHQHPNVFCNDSAEKKALKCPIWVDPSINLRLYTKIWPFWLVRENDNVLSTCHTDRVSARKKENNPVFTTLREQQTSAQWSASPCWRLIASHGCWTQPIYKNIVGICAHSMLEANFDLFWPRDVSISRIKFTQAYWKMYCFFKAMNSWGPHGKKH